jgi:outer membrane protein assembly factor BamD
MNRLWMKIGAVTLVVLLAGASLEAKPKRPKKKKEQDLSANPLANVASKQPDKELFDKAMIALKKNRFAQHLSGFGIPDARQACGGR